MGVIISSIALATKSIKKKRDKKKAEKIQENYGPQGAAREQQSLQHQDTFGEGLRDEHLAAVVPPSQQPGRSELHADTTPLPASELHGNQVSELQGAQVDREQETEAIGRTGGEPEVQRAVAIEAPIPLAAGTAASNTANQTTNSTTTREVQKEGADKMASDEDYAAFLEKANQDPNEGVAKNQSKGKVELKAVDSGVEIPAVLKKATEDAFYISDADEPFVPVCLKHSGKSLPDEAAFAKLVNHPNLDDTDVTIMDVGEWDTQGQYKDVVEATREASKGGEVRVYSISRGGPRVEYWVVGLEGGKLVGVKALAIES
ncbi:hypothetical protein G7Y89_g6197 [Cudoniella acicularis]|uniref:Uncharacterized protein n=1 Tax=Cudoniella acicularis TaxID=354080 RepID=A0A8H4W388_9HELO|nr:hypothetical protein G7Y89_g6197 [Cudoniella acicularis]